MPKKRSYKHFQGPSKNAPGNGQTASKDDSPTQSVNELLSSLRVGNPYDTAAKKRELAELVSQRSVPPNIRVILGVPDTAPPRARAAERNRERIRTPGPAPPRSWTAARTPTLALRARRRVLKAKTTEDRLRPSTLMRFANLIDGEVRHESNRGAKSLLHHALRTVAEQWSMLDEADFPALVDVPLRLRLRLLSYISFYGSALDIRSFRALTQGSENVLSLDLAGLVGHSTLTLPRLAKLFKPDRGEASVAASETISDSWDQVEPSENLLVSNPAIGQFTQLTQLCLSHPPPTILWKDLLLLTRQTGQLTHLSLACWPRPTLTPNLATSTVSTQHMEVHAGGSHFYSSYDQDLSEPTSILKQLSQNLLRLLWLDLEACATWSPALANLAVAHETEKPDTEWRSSDASGTPVLAGNWKQLSHIIVRQNWLPTYAGIQALPTQQGISSDRPLIKRILDQLPLSTTETHDQLDVEKRKAQMWLETEHRLLSTGREINMNRKKMGLSPVILDHGWSQTPR